MTTLTAAVVALLAGLVGGVAVGRRVTVGALRRFAGRVAGQPPPSPHASDAYAAVERALADGRAETARVGAELAELRRGLDELPIGVVVGSATGPPLLRNRAADALLGQRHTDALIVRAVDDHLRTAITGQSRRQLVDLSGPPKRSIVVRSAPVPAADAGAAAAVGLVTVEDVSDRVRLEAMRTDFVANISHELRTPVGALALLAETLQGERDAETIDRLSGKLEVEARRVSHLIGDLLELSRIEVEGARRDRISVDAIIGESVDRVRSSAEQRSITVERRLSGAAGAIAGDRQQLVSAVANLVDNAVKYSEPGGFVTVGDRRDGAEIVVEVTDSGIGIPARDLDRVFERFYRVDRARSRTTGGTGLGLAIVRHVADNHGGSIAVSSQEGVGSTFTLRLPAWAESSPVEPIVARSGAGKEAS